jgi:tetratricopeptide (TPR) repeat protein
MYATRVFVFGSMISMSVALMAQPLPIRTTTQAPSNSNWIGTRSGPFDRESHVVDQPSISLGVPTRTSQEEAVASTVSIYKLQHDIPKKAAKEFELAAKARDKGTNEEAVAHLEKAVQIDPNFAEAHNNLAAIYLESQKPDPAISETQAALKADPQSAPAYCNLTLAYLMKQSFGDAEQAARRLADVDRTGSFARLLLGFSLVLQDKFTHEAAFSLKKAQSDYPQAEILLARIDAARGDIAAARGKLEQYLATKDNYGRQLAERWLDALNQAMQAGNRLK